MASINKELEEKLLEAGNKLFNPPCSVNNLLRLLSKIQSCLSRVEQSPTDSMHIALSPLLKALIVDKLVKHPNVDVKVALASCFSEITRIAAPDVPYDDDHMKVLRLIVSSFENLHDKSSRWYKERVSILEMVAICRLSVIMLDLECDALILEMFRHFFKTIREYHPENVFSSMKTIMVLVLEESEDVSLDLLSPILDSLNKDNEVVLPIARKLGESVLQKCTTTLKPDLRQAALLSIQKYIDTKELPGIRTRAGRNKFFDKMPSMKMLMQQMKAATSIAATVLGNQNEDVVSGTVLNEGGTSGTSTVTDVEKSCLAGVATTVAAGASLPSPKSEKSESKDSKESPKSSKDHGDSKKQRDLGKETMPAEEPKMKRLRHGTPSRDAHDRLVLSGAGTQVAPPTADVRKEGSSFRIPKSFTSSFHTSKEVFAQATSSTDKAYLQNVGFPGRRNAAGVMVHHLLQAASTLSIVAGSDYDLLNAADDLAENKNLKLELEKEKSYRKTTETSLTNALSQLKTAHNDLTAAQNALRENKSKLVEEAALVETLRANIRNHEGDLENATQKVMSYATAEEKYGSPAFLSVKLISAENALSESEKSLDSLRKNVSGKDEEVKALNEKCSALAAAGINAATESFENALQQVEALFPSMKIDRSKVSVFMEVKDGKIVHIPDDDGEASSAPSAAQ